jgi:hypothetical protein
MLKLVSITGNSHGTIPLEANEIILMLVEVFRKNRDRIETPTSEPQRRRNMPG